ncbi:MAG TPA: GlsB/YeaQ/YmgE family stress response membrane protein [Anaerolineales bacterium]|nr:GlsB/YeaQ/YmgE family stress response membrane protein [Anaerolineales bacterium]
MTLTSIVTWIVVGGIAGLLAEWLIGGVRAGCIGTVIIGILGAFIGGWLFTFFHISIGSGIVGEIISAFVGAAVLLLVIRILRRV